MNTKSRINKYAHGIPNNASQRDLFQDVENLKKLQRGSNTLKITLKKFLANLISLAQIEKDAPFKTKRRTLNAQIISDASAINSKLKELFD